MTSSKETPRLIRCAPYFPVADVGKTLEFYTGKLGFRAEYSAGRPLQFAICSRDGLPIMLRLVSRPELVAPSEAQGGTWDAFFWVREIDALHSEFLSGGVEIAYGPLVQEAYGMKEFAIRDLDGHVLGFGETLRA